MTDPRITAYALGELEGRAREEFERELAASDLLQNKLNETLNLAKDLGSLPMPTELLDPEERTALLQQCADHQSAARRHRRILRWIVPTTIAAAACLLLLPSVFRPQDASLAKRKDLTGEIVQRAAVAQFPDQASSSVIAKADDALPVPSSAPVLAAAVPMSETAERRMAAVGVDQLRQSEIASLSQGWGKAEGRGSSTRGGFADDSKAFVLRADDFNTEAYNAIRENVFLNADVNPLSTFSIDVDTASYSNVRRFLQSDQLPPAGAIRTEELINYFRYAYPQPEGSAPFSVNVEAARAPWDSNRELVRIGLRGRETHAAERAPSNLVFLIDSSGSMDSPDKLPLLQRSLRALVENLSPKDRVAIIAYAGSSGLVLPSTPGTKKQEIIKAFTNLSAGGSTHGSEGIRLAYEVARENFLKEGSNRVILCTDGDFNVGITDQSELQRLIEKERASGVFLSVLGFGAGNLKDSTMELLADKGNGNYAYIDSLTEGRKVLVEEMGSTLFTIAKDVKIQVEFNPSRVAGYRLIGYENRLLAKEDFNDDKKDAGEIGEGHTITALYEIIPAGQAVPGQPSVDPLKYQKPGGAASAPSDELLTVKLRYKAPDGDKSELFEVPFTAKEMPDFGKASEDFRFASAVAAFGMKLRNSPEQGDISWDDIQKITRGSLGEDAGSYRAEFLMLIERAKSLSSRQK